MNGEFIEEADVASKLGVDFDVRVQKANEREAKRVANEKLQAGMPTALELSALLKECGELPDSLRRRFSNIVMHTAELQIRDIQSSKRLRC